MFIYLNGQSSRCPTAIASGQHTFLVASVAGSSSDSVREGGIHSYSLSSEGEVCLERLHHSDPLVLSFASSASDQVVSGGKVYMYSGNRKEGQPRYQVLVHDLADPSALRSLVGNTHIPHVIGSDGTKQRTSSMVHAWLGLSHTISLGDGVILLNGLTSSSPKPRTYLYDTEHNAFTRDLRDTPSYKTHALVCGRVHAFASNGAHFTYTVKGGWVSEGMLPDGVQPVSRAEAFGRLILLFKWNSHREYIHVYDTISGDCIKLVDSPRCDKEFVSITRVVRVGHRILKLDVGFLQPGQHRDTPQGERLDGFEGRVGYMYTLNPALLYPSEEMGWGRVLEWDKSRRDGRGE
ncbi:hypothetical protein KIPB_010206 [Kipferlia bialata]|uniref:Uncharacterized protein n=1 Tax=Kipferlia bialata TaxID=797122 RepID=A0A9K3D685_9EUKA|nr:hypothetical protein KIPB_010206 [Kipferlia bialata]|eukprot:g10206.t1